MYILISTLVLAGIISVSSKGIKKHRKILYFIALILSSLTIGLYWTGVSRAGENSVVSTIMALFLNSTIGSSLFILVMLAAVLPKKMKLTKALYSTRAELSIIASILVLGHNLAYGKLYFIRFFSGTTQFSTSTIIAIGISFIMILLMLPLFITSFPSVRKRMKASNWKHLQKYAYIFYILMYVHVMLLFLPLALQANTAYLINVIVYTLIYFYYAVARVFQASHKNVLTLATTCAMVALVAICYWTVEFSDKAIKAKASMEEPIKTYVVQKKVKGKNRYKNGSYEGESMGYVDTVKLKVDLENDIIQSVEVVEHQEDILFYNKAKVLYDDIVFNNSTDVDIVSGATVTSLAIIDAVNNAMEKAVN